MKMRRNKRRYGVHPIWKERKNKGHYHNLIREMRNQESEFFRKYLRMTPSSFDKLLKLIQDRMKKYSQNEPISPGERLAVTLRFLATGDSYKSLSYAFYLGFSTVQKIIPETCDIIWNALKDKYIPGNNSVVLLAIADAHCRFLAVDIGAYGSFSDGGVLRASALGQQLKNGTLELPEPSMLPNSNILAPHVLIGDEAFQLRQDFLRPFPGKQLSTMRQIFNYRLSRARRCIECAFGLLANRWRVYRSPIYLMPNNVDKVIKATIVLHNYMINEDNVTGKAIYCPSGYMDHIDENGM